MIYVLILLFTQAKDNWWQTATAGGGGKTLENGHDSSISEMQQKMRGMYLLFIKWIAITATNISVLSVILAPQYFYTQTSNKFDSIDKASP